MAAPNGSSASSALDGLTSLYHRLWSKFWIIFRPRSTTTIRPTSAYKEGCRELQLTQTKPIEDITSPSPHCPPCFPRKNGWKETRKYWDAPPPPSTNHHQFLGLQEAKVNLNFPLKNSSTFNEPYMFHTLFSLHKNHRNIITSSLPHIHRIPIMQHKQMPITM